MKIQLIGENTLAKIFMICFYLNMMNEASKTDNHSGSFQVKFENCRISFVADRIAFVLTYYLSQTL